MVLLADVINQDLSKGVIFGKGQLGKIKQLVKFVLLIFIPWWILVPVAASASLHDITLLKKFLGMKKMLMHWWENQLGKHSTTIFCALWKKSCHFHCVVMLSQTRRKEIFEKLQIYED